MIATSMMMSNTRRSIWLVGVSFVLFQFFMQLSSGVVIGAIMEERHLTALTAGFLGSSLYIVYTILQMPVGVLFDRKNTRLLLSLNAFVCGLGCIVFALSYSLPALFFARLLIGTGSAFAFIGLSHLLRQHYPLKQFAFMIGLSETLAFFVTVIAMISLGELLSLWGWRNFILSAGIIGCIISLLCWKFIPDSTPPKPTRNYKLQVLEILKNGKAWINGLFVGLNFTIVTVFGALWAVPFLQVKLSCTLPQATTIGAMFFLGAGISCPLFGWLACRFMRRKPLILTSCASTLMLLLFIIYAPIQNPIFLGILMCSMGICCGAYMLAYTIANELAPLHSLSTCTGFTNTLAILSAPLLQPLTGYILDSVSVTEKYTTLDFQKALVVIPISLLLAGILVLFLPEKEISHT
jgi:MFS family permease